MNTMETKKKEAGSLEVICGSMFSGKSEELIRRLHRAQWAQLNVAVFKHFFDNRKSNEHIVSHNGTKLPAYALRNPQDIFMHNTSEMHVVGIDEVQFFSQDIIPIICALIDHGKRVIVAGLDLDFRGKPFGCMPTLLALADSITKLKAICIVCGQDAHFTQRLVNGNPARAQDPLILVGAQEAYQARCRVCHVVAL